MTDTWGNIAHDALDKPQQPIQASATDITRFGAPIVAVVTAVITGVLGAAWKVDPSEPAVVIATAIIVAAVVLGLYFAFASDVRTRGAVTIARFEAITSLADSSVATAAEPSKSASTNDAVLKSAEDRLTKAVAELETATKQMAAAETELHKTRRDLKGATSAMRDAQARLQETESRNVGTSRSAAPGAERHDGGTGEAH